MISDIICCSLREDGRLYGSPAYAGFDGIGIRRALVVLARFPVIFVINQSSFRYCICLLFKISIIGLECPNNRHVESI